MNIVEVSLNNLRDRVNTLYEARFGRKNLGPASPLGQLTDVVLALIQDNYLYLRNVIRELDFRRTNDARVIQTVADMAGHIRKMAIPARGTLRMKVKATFDLDELPFGQIIFTNLTTLRNSTNGLPYSIDLGGANRAVYQVTKTSEIVLPIMQAIISQAIFTGSGLSKQFYTIPVSDEVFPAEWGIQVYVNSVPWTRRKSFVDMKPGELAFYVRPGHEGGFDIGFGNGSWGEAPPAGAEIFIQFLTTFGASGNLLINTVNDWQYDGGVVQSNGEEIDIIEVFDIYIDTPPNLGADSESLNFTKQIVPHVSTNFVLATEKQFEYFFSSNGRFSYVKVWTDYFENLQKKSSLIYVTLIPNVLLLYGNRYNYFNMPYEAFYIDDIEKDALLTELATQVVTHINTEVVLITPVIERWVTWVQVRLFEDPLSISQQSIKEEIVIKNCQQAIANYYIRWVRKDRMPQSDIIRIIEGVAGVDSCTVFFVSESNEKYHREMAGKPGYNPNTSIGIDPVMGDAVFTPGSIPIFRGGWYDRDSAYYRDELTEDGSLGSCNIQITGYSKQ